MAHSPDELRATHESLEKEGGKDVASGCPPIHQEAMKRRLVEHYPHCLDEIRLEDLRPDLFPEDRFDAELIIIRDRLRGIEHPELWGKLTAKG